MFNEINNIENIVSRRSLYCVWIRAREGQPAPLVSIWIDPAMTCFEPRGAKAACDSAGVARVSARDYRQGGGRDEFQDEETVTPTRRPVSVLLSSMTLVFLCLLLLPGARSQTTGKITGMVKDQTDAVIAGAEVAAVNTTTGAKQSTTTNEDGAFTFPVVPVGEYQLDVNSTGFKPYRRTGLRVDINGALVVDVKLQVSEQSEAVMVTEDTTQVETTDTQLGQVIGSKQVTEIPLNGRAYTDLFSTQAGVSPITTSGAANSSSGGGFGTVAAAGNDNTGQFSINGQRESANGFSLNGASVQETIGQQAGIIPTWTPSPSSES
jgi:hypothetical protein